MIWRIFRKDFQQLWRLGAVVATAQLTNGALWFGLEPFNQPRGLVTFAQLFATATVLGMASLIVAVVHEDAVPGVSQDWLIRPIRRRDLLCAKLIFVAAMVQGPALLADLAHGMAARFTFIDSLAAAAARSAFMLLVFDIPILALAAVTSRLVQVIATGLAIWLAVMVGVFAGIPARGGAPPFASSGIQWMTPAYWSGLAWSCALVIIPLQYFRRATRHSRWVVAAAVLLAPVLSVSTWASAFAVQQRLSRDASVARSIGIALDTGAATDVAAPNATSSRTLLLPLRVSGLPPESILINDRADVRLVSREGTPIYRGKSTPFLGYGDDFVVRTTTGGEVRTRQQLIVPGGIYERLRNQALHMEIEYSLTLFQLAETGRIPALHGHQQVSGFGWCRTEVDEDGDEIKLGCVQAGAAPSCVSVTFDNLTNDQRGLGQWSCDPDYSPYPTHLFPDSISRLGVSVKFPNGPQTRGDEVSGPAFTDAALRLKSYRPAAHFTRRLIVPDLSVAQ